MKTLVLETALDDLVVAVELIIERNRGVLPVADIEHLERALERLRLARQCRSPAKKRTLSAEAIGHLLRVLGVMKDVIELL